MKLLYISQYFPPEIGAPSNRALANVRHLAERGHSVTVLTEMPNHPKGIIFNGYRGKFFTNETVAGCSVLRVWVFTSQKKTFLTRILFYSSFMLLGTLYALLTWRKYDVMYVSSPPLFVAVTGIALKKIFPGIKLVFEVRDLWPDVAISIGELKNQKLISLSKKIERTICRLSDRIVAVTYSFKKEIVRKGTDPDKIVVIRNGSDFLFKVDNNPARRDELKRSLNPEDDFLALYAGNFGLAQNLTTILKAARKLNGRGISFLLVGCGPREEDLKRMAAEWKLTNLRFVDEVPKEEIVHYLDLADCGIIPLRKTAMFAGTVPSKLFDYMACNLPVLLGVAGEALDILKEAEAGLGFEPDNHDDLVGKILWLRDNPRSLKDMASKGRKFVMKNFTRETQAEKVEKEILSLQVGI